MKPPSKLKPILAIAGVMLLLTAAFVGLRNCGNYLIVDNASKSDVILVPSRGMPLRYDRGVDLLRNGYAGHIIADVPAFTYFGHPAPELAQQYFAQQPDLAGSGGHEAVFTGRRVFPYNFLSKHYPVRSQAHGERKIFVERSARRSESARRWTASR